MKMKDLRTGMVIRNRDNGYFLVLRNYENENGMVHDIYLAAMNYPGYYYDSIKDDLTSKVSKTLDIIEVFIAENTRSPLTQSALKSIWRRDDAKEMTIEEIQNKLGYKIKIVE